MNQLAVLQALRLKGRVEEPDLAATVGADPATLAASIAELTGAGLVAEGKMLRLTPEGREKLAELLAAERGSIDPTALAQAYSDFRSVNNDFKALSSDWQLKDGQSNDHADKGYDDAVLTRPIMDSYHTVWFELHEELIGASGLTRDEEAAAGHAD